MDTFRGIKGNVYRPRALFWMRAFFFCYNAVTDDTARESVTPSYRFVEAATMDRRAVDKRFECAFAHLGLASPGTWGTVRRGETGEEETVVSAVEREDVRRAYRRLLLRAHPDRNGGRSEAYETLIEARDAAYALIDERDLLACASRYDWRASRRKSTPREGRGEDLGARPRRAGDDSADEETERTTTMKNLDDVRAYVHGKSKMKEEEALARVEARFVHESKVTVLTSRLGFVATGERNGRVQVWREDGSLVARFDSPLRDDVKTNDAVSILRFGASGRLGITYVTTKPRVCRVNFDECSVSSPTQTRDGHVGRITAAKWFEHDEDSVQGINDVFATGSIDGAVFLRSFSSPLIAIEAAASKEFRACVALDVLATSVSQGVLVVADTAGKFRLWNVLNNSTTNRIEVSPLTNVVAWSGFGGVSSCALAFAPNDETLRLITAFNNPSTKQSRVLEWTILRRGVNNTVHGFSAAFPGESETFTGSIADCVTAPPADDEDEETHLVVVDDSVFAVGATSRTILYVVDAPNCRRCVLSSSQNGSDSDAFLSVAAETSTNRAKADDASRALILRLHSLDDGSTLGESRLSSFDVFGDDSSPSSSSSSSSAFVFEDSPVRVRPPSPARADDDDDEERRNRNPNRKSRHRPSVLVGRGCVVASLHIQRG